MDQALPQRAKTDAATDGPASYLPLPDADWPPELADMLRGFAGRLNVYRVMARHPALLRAWAPLRDHVVLRNTLGAQRSEVCILRTGHRLDAAYEWSHHVSRARACGMAEARIHAVRGEPEAMLPEDAVIARAVDELVDRACLSRPAREALEALAGPQGVFDVIAAVGFYTTLACIVRSFDTPVDADVAAELAERPLGA